MHNIMYVIWKLKYTVDFNYAKKTLVASNDRRRDDGVFRIIFENGRKNNKLHRNQYAGCENTRPEWGSCFTTTNGSIFCYTLRKSSPNTPHERSTNTHNRLSNRN